jgi:hypothetical protein
LWESKDEVFVEEEIDEIGCSNIEPSSMDKQ